MSINLNWRRPTPEQLKASATIGVADIQAARDLVQRISAPGRTKAPTGQLVTLSAMIARQLWESDSK